MTKFEKTIIVHVRRRGITIKFQGNDEIDTFVLEKVDLGTLIMEGHDVVRLTVTIYDNQGYIHDKLYDNEQVIVNGQTTIPIHYKFRQEGDYTVYIKVE